MQWIKKPCITHFHTRLIYILFACMCVYIIVECILKFACLWAYTYMGVPCVYMHMEARGWYEMPFFMALHLIYWGKWTLNSLLLTSITSQVATGFPSLCPLSASITAGSTTARFWNRFWRVKLGFSCLFKDCFTHQPVSLTLALLFQ